MKNKILIIITTLILTFAFHLPISMSTVNTTETKINSKKIQKTQYSSTLKFIKEPELIDPDYQKVIDITGWDIEISTYFVKEG